MPHPHPQSEAILTFSHVFAEKCLCRRSAPPSPTPTDRHPFPPREILDPPLCTFAENSVKLYLLVIFNDELLYKRKVKVWSKTVMQESVHKVYFVNLWNFTHFSEQINFYQTRKFNNREKVIHYVKNLLTR